MKQPGHQMPDPGTPEKKRAAQVGAVAVGIIILLFVAVLGIRDKQNTRSDQVYQQVHQAIADIAKNGPTNCTADFPVLRNQVKTQLKKTSAFDFFLNKKAIVYDMTLKRAQTICTSKKPAVCKAQKNCTDSPACFEAATNCLLSGQTQSAKNICRTALIEHEDEAVRVLIDMIQDIERLL